MIFFNLRMSENDVSCLRLKKLFLEVLIQIDSFLSTL